MLVNKSHAIASRSFKQEPKINSMQDLLVKDELQKRDLNTKNLERAFFQSTQLQQVYPFITSVAKSTFRFSGDRGGTGVLVSEHGHIMTCSHIANRIISTTDREQESIFFSTGEHFSLRNSSVVFNPEVPDIAVIKVPQLSGRDYLKISKADPVVSQRTLLIGYPGCMNGVQVISIGNIKKINHYVEGDGECFGASFPVFKNTCLAAHGHSGGPVVDEFGQLLGIHCRGTWNWYEDPAKWFKKGTLFSYAVQFDLDLMGRLHDIKELELL